MLADQSYEEGFRLIRNYPSIGEFLSDAMSPSEVTRPSSHKEGRSDSWDLGAGWDGATKMMQEGWPEGRKAVEAIADRMREDVLYNTTGIVERNIIRRSVAGFAPNVPAHLSRVPLTMWDMKSTPVDRPVVHIVLNGVLSAYVQADAARRKGAAVAALVDLLESTKRRCLVEVMASLRGYTDNASVEYRIVVKNPQEALQLDSLAFTMAHPAFFRRLGFAWLENMPAEMRRRCDVPGGYGVPIETMGEKGDLYIPQGLEWRDNEQAIAWIKETLAELGVLDSAE